MTFSLAALDPATGMFGIASSSSSIAVGNRCPWARAGVGAVLTQHRTDTRAGPLGLDLLARGYSAKETVDLLVAGSEHPGQRQFAALDREGRAAFFNGPQIESINSGCIGTGCVAAGNFLATADVSTAMVQAFEASPAGAFVERLLAALDAGVAAGGETQPVMAAALLVVDRHSWPLVDLRVDFEPDPHLTLRRLWRSYEPLVDRFVTQVLRPYELKPLINSALTI
ncbi:DUF1028 domain-containing protein [Roseomonas terrae]|uniref:DUF1028 domain-containing protein n=1 Tax=Neoroseomonas terrae TaxID=424799 RepID=A0ABS5EQ46_9PROT|nr:DUF1028 domain-containing protein [Neoroseomonas terrae]MBR0653160.1 DUF1028 domain-containing protein [Neoroseomonas terrae]